METNKNNKRGRKPKAKEIMTEEIQDEQLDNIVNEDVQVEVQETETIVENEVMDLTEAKAPETVKGLGDVVKKVTKVLGIEECEDCEKRRKKLNKMFPYTKRVKETLTEEDITFVKSIEKKLTKEQRITLGSIYDRVFGTKTRECSSCPGIYKGILERLNVQIEYQKIGNA